jgi:hypothetical protein
MCHGEFLSQIVFGKQFHPRYFSQSTEGKIYLLTPCSRVLLEKLTGFAANQEIPRILWNKPESSTDRNLNLLPFTYLCASSKLQKATINFFLSVRPSVRMGKLGSTMRYFHEILLNYF